MIKNFVKSLFRKLGLEVHRLPKGQPLWNYPTPPQWMHTGAMLTEPELEDGSFLLQVFGNRVFRSKEITLRRSKYGEDYRLKHIVAALDVRGLRVLELGPYFGHHTFLLDKLGAAGIVAVESRENNVRMCEKLKKQFGLDRATFVLQDVEALVKGEEPKFSGPFDLVFCMGLLYHLPDPVSALIWFRRQAPSLFLGTHYFEPAEPGRYPSHTYISDAVIEQNGQRYHGVWLVEGGVGHAPSGMSPRSFVPNEADLLRMVRAAGYSQISVLGRDLQYNTPHITLIAEA